jgi:hypothetical protein
MIHLFKYQCCGSGREPHRFTGTDADRRNNFLKKLSNFSFFTGYFRNRRQHDEIYAAAATAEEDNAVKEPQIFGALSRDVIAMIGGDIRLSCHIQNLQNKTVGLRQPFYCDIETNEFLRLLESKVLIISTLRCIRCCQMAEFSAK